MHTLLYGNNQEPLYLFTLVKTNDIKPLVRIANWDTCMEMLSNHTIESNDAGFYNHVIHQEIVENESTEASCLCNRKGRGNDYFTYITIERAIAE